MDDLPTGSMEGAPLPPEPAEELLAKAEDARHRQVWEESIRLYRFSLQKSPQNIDAVLGLAAAYEGKSREPGYESYFQSAMESYRKAVALEPGSVKVHDAFLAAVVKAGALDGLMEEYKRMAAAAGEGHAQIFKDATRKIQTLLIMQTANVKKGPPPLPGIMTFTLGVAAPLTALVSLAAAVILRLKAEGGDAHALISFALTKISAAAFFAFIGYKVFVYWRTNR